MERDFSRYHRQMLLPGFGEARQARLRDSTVLLLGCGALGSIAADMLARAGVGHLVVVDRDVIELTNLQRQVLFDEADVAEGIPKAEAARRRIARINSEVRVTAVVDDVNHANIGHHAEGADLIFDGLDNFETRYLANDIAVKRGVPYVYGAAVGTTGMAFPILPRSGGEAPWETADGGSHATPCLRCLFEEPPPPGTSPTCDTVGVVGPAVGMVANFQVAEALKILTGQYDRVCRTLLNFDLWTNEILQLRVADSGRDGGCPCCVRRQFDYLDGKAGSSAASLCGRNAVQLRHRQQTGGIDLESLARRLGRQGEVRANEFMLTARLQDGDTHFEVTVFPDGRAIVKGTSEPDVARGIYAKYVGS